MKSQFISKLLKINKKEHVNIWVRKSIVKFGKAKSILIEVSTPDQNFFIFKEREHYNDIILNPVNVIEMFTDSQKIKELVHRDGFFYFNGKEIIVKELL